MREPEDPPSHHRGTDDGVVMPPLLEKALAPAHVATMRAVLACRRRTMLDVAAFADRLGDGRVGALGALERAERAFKNAFGVPVLAPHRPWFEDDAQGDGAVAVSTLGDQDPAEGPDRTALAKAFVDLLEVPPEVRRRAGPAPAVDCDVRTWVAALVDATAARCGMHLALRVDRDHARAIDDFVALLDEAGLRSTVLDSDGRELAFGLLRVEFHAPACPVVIVGPDRLLEPEPGRADPEEWAAAPMAAGGPTAHVLDALPWLVAMRCVCVWCVDADAVVPGGLDGMVAGCVGPVRPGRAWSREHVARALPGAGPAGVAAIAASLGDARDVEARARAVRRVAATGLDVDDACRFVARSLAPAAEPAEHVAAFDLALHAHDAEIALLFSRAAAVAANGGRLLFHGPPGGGKSTLARALAAEMARTGASGPAVVVSAASILAKAYGATERLLERLWRRAEIAGSPLVVDEIDAMCGVRDPSSSSGNAYLVRVLTDEWLRRFDDHPGVAVLASCNSLEAVDPGVLRRFSCHHRVGDELPPDLERRAWTSILGMDPPRRWSPCGASPADFATALGRCRMLGLADAASHADAVLKARDARRGPRRAQPKSGGLVH